MGRGGTADGIPPQVDIVSSASRDCCELAGWTTESLCGKGVDWGLPAQDSGICLELAMPRPRYPYDVTDAEWTILAPLVPSPLPGGRPPHHPRREIVNAILYVLRTGCQWRAVPHDLPPWGTVWWYFRQWRDAGVWEQINTALREQDRVRVGREPTPSAAILDSQSAKTTEKGGLAAMTRARKSRGASATSSSRRRGGC